MNPTAARSTVGNSRIRSRLIHGEKGDGRRSHAAAGWFLAIKEGALKHLIGSPFGAYEMLTEANKAQKQGDWG